MENQGGERSLSRGAICTPASKYLKIDMLRELLKEGNVPQTEISEISTQLGGLKKKGGEEGFLCPFMVLSLSGKWPVIPTRLIALKGQSSSRDSIDDRLINCQPFRSASVATYRAGEKRPFPASGY